MDLNLADLGGMIKKHRAPSGIRAAAKEIGIPPATLSRIENGDIPDLKKFALICAWLGANPAHFLGMQPKASNLSSASVHLRKKDTTSLDTATSLGEMIIKAQEALRDREAI